jgi:hypothetical protein
LVVDDQPQLVALTKERTDATVRIVHPRDLDEHHIRDADLILVDHALKEWNLTELPYACRPSDGIAVAGIIRAHHRRLECSPVAIALYSGELTNLAPDVHPQEHLISMAFGLEWAFPKQPRADVPDLDVQVEILARAVRDLPRSWSQDEPDDLARQVSRLLGIAEQTWETRALGEVERCRPPVHQLSNWTDGLAILRWLLHRILPYPCFLLGIQELAIRLRVSLEWLRGEMVPGKPLFEALSQARYRGLLGGFLGDRWWWGGWEEEIRKGVQAAPTSITDVHGWLAGVAGRSVEPLKIEQPVLAYDADTNFSSIESMKDCVRIQPDTWPSYADEPWCQRKLAHEDARLRSYVLAADLDAVEEA